MAAIIIEQPAPSSAEALHAAYEQRAEDWRRDHLGASIIGHECDRYLWLSFRWALQPEHKGRLLRLFARGQREEAWIVEDLRAAGFTVLDRDPETGEQFRVRWGHLGGSLDGRISGLLESSKEHVLEVKTFNAKQFDWLKKVGVKKAKPQHYTQMQVYMRGSGIDRAFYVAVCKDSDEIHSERVKLDIAIADKAIARALAVIETEKPAARLGKDLPPCVLVSKDGTHWPCQFFEVCHGSTMPAKSCRTCISSEAWQDGWVCVEKRRVLDGAAQRAGCGDHVTIPAAVNAQVAEVDGRRVTFQFSDGRVVKDGAA